MSSVHTKLTRINSELRNQTQNDTQKLWNHTQLLPRNQPDFYLASGTLSSQRVPLYKNITIIVLETIADTVGVPCRQEWRIFRTITSLCICINYMPMLCNLLELMPFWWKWPFEPCEAICSRMNFKNHNIFKWGQVNGMICTSNTCRPCPHNENNDLSIDHHDPYWAQESDHIFSPNLESV